MPWGWISGFFWCPGAGGFDSQEPFAVWCSCSLGAVNTAGIWVLQSLFQPLSSSQKEAGLWKRCWRASLAALICGGCKCIVLVLLHRFIDANTSLPVNVERSQPEPEPAVCTRKRDLNSHKIWAGTGMELVNQFKGKCKIIWVSLHLNPISVMGLWLSRALQKLW